MIIELKDLQVGDEFLTGSNSHFRWWKLVRPIKLRKNYTDRWASARCSTRINIVQGYTKYDWKTKTRIPTTKKEYVCSDNHNAEVYVDLNWKDIWLLKRGGTKI